MKEKVLFTIIGIMTTLCSIKAQVPLNPDPIWSYSYSSPRDIAFCDINNDGYLDLAVVREGVSQAPEQNYIFINNKGVLESSPSWQSTDADYSIGCAFGDVDNDGDMDLAVGNYKVATGRVKLYENENGVMNPTPVWTASSDGGCWVGWGDVDGDGDLDLAAVDLFYYPCVFYNNNGSLETTPSWRATDYDIDLCGAWIDVDKDGDLDLAVGNINGLIPLLRIYKNTNGTLEHVASWTSMLPNYTGIEAAEGMAVGDINGDSWLDIALSNEMNDACENYAFMNTGGEFDTTPSWISTDLYKSIRCILGDVDGDGDLDMAYANYLDPPMLYLNNNGVFSNTPDWSSNVVGEWGVAFGDVDNDGIVQTIDTLYGNDTLKLFYISHYPIQKLDTIKVDNVPLPLSDYCYARESGWFSLKNAPSLGSIITVQYSYSLDMELAVGGAYLFENTNASIAEKKLPPRQSESEKLPTILYSLNQIHSLKSLDIYTSSGRRVRVTDEKLGSGVYFYKLKGSEKTGKIILLRR